MSRATNETSATSPVFKLLMQNIFFILGCQRTGTTLLRLILEAHPEVFCYDELRGYAVLQKFVPEDLPRVRCIGFKLPRWTEQLTSQVVSDEGLDERCDNFYRGEKILFLHRDARDTVASMLKLKAGDSNWCQIWVPRIIGAKRAGDRLFRARYAAELEIIEGCNNQLIGLAAVYWKYKTESLFSYRDAEFPVLAVSYERLVTKPRGVLPLICAHLGVPFHENLLRHNTFSHPELFENGLTLGNTDPTLPIHFDSVGQWQRLLSDHDVDLIERIAGDLPKRIAALDAESRGISLARCA
jgi:hypothetical protein